MINKFLPISKDDMINRGWSYVDFVLVTADAYVDHPSFANAIISRVLYEAGYKIGIIPQPDWNDISSFNVFGKPRYAFLVSGGNIDSMVNHYTVNKKKRHTDSYSPGGKTGFRPDRPTIVYSNKIKELYKDVPIIIGGIEASLRRFSHYDYWQDKIRRSVLCDSQADLLLYGMGERSIVEVAHRLKNNKELTDIKGSCYLTKNINHLKDYIMLPALSEVKSSKNMYAKSVRLQYEEHNPYIGKTLVEKQDDNYYLVQNPPQKPLSREELDKIYSFDYQRTYHPIYEKDGGIPAIDEVKFSIISERGCFGGCNFCSLAFHQGRIVTSRSEKSILKEAEKLTKYKDFKGYIHDVGGPTANFRFPACSKQNEKGACKNKQCLAPTPCKNLKVSHSEYLNLLRKIKKIKGVKKVFIRSGIRFDYLLYDEDKSFFKELVKDHISGQLKVAPEHCSEKVLQLMGKPNIEVFNEFKRQFNSLSSKMGKKQFLIPYLISSHPGCTLKDAVMLAEFIRDMKYQPEQVQDFYPTPGTISTCMYYTGIDPRTEKNVYVPKSEKEKQMQRALMQYKKKENYKLVEEALIKSGRTDLIGNSPKCLINQSKNERKMKNERTDNKRKRSISKNKGKNKKRSSRT